jgi:hypothetical protein
MKRVILLSLLLVLAISGYGFAASVTITLAHANGTTTLYTSTGSTVSAACGTAFANAAAALASGDEMQIPAVTACTFDAETYPISVSNIKIVGMGPALTILTPNPEMDLTGLNQTLEGVTVNAPNADKSAVYIGPPSSAGSTYTLRNLILSTANGMQQTVSGFQFYPLESGQALYLDHVNITGGDYGMLAETDSSTSGGVVDVRDSVITSLNNNAISTYGALTIIVYDTVLTNVLDTDGDGAVNLGGSTFNAYAGTSILPETGSPAVEGSGSCTLYPGSYSIGSYSPCTIPSAH